MDLHTLQEEIKEWVGMNFPDAQTWEPLVGAFEEMGELAHSFLKAHQGIRQDQPHDVNMIDAVGDIVIYLAHFCLLQGIDLQFAVELTWASVKRRDWREERGLSDGPDLSPPPSGSGGT